jgi:putative FmdB family regulatory protein
MPTYTFKCNNCYLKFNRFAKMAEKASVKCPDCKNQVESLPAQGIAVKMAESTSIPKDIDMAIGRDADERRKEYEKRKKIKDKLRKESGSERLSRDMDGNYTPLSSSISDEISEETVVDIRKQVFKDYHQVKNDPESEKIVDDNYIDPKKNMKLVK